MMVYLLALLTLVIVLLVWVELWTLYRLHTTIITQESLAREMLVLAQRVNELNSKIENLDWDLRG